MAFYNPWAIGHQFTQYWIINQMSDGTHLRFVLLVYLQVAVEHTLEPAKKNIEAQTSILLTVLYGLIVAVLVTWVKHMLRPDSCLVAAPMADLKARL